MFGEKSCFIKRGIVVVGILFIATVILAIGVTADGNPVYVDDDASSGWYDATHVKTIQEGINNVTQGGTVYVWNGTYRENVIVNKSITLEANSSSVLDGIGGYGMSITVNDTVIKNITVTNCTVGGPPSVGIFVYNSLCILQNITLDTVTVNSSDVGVYIIHTTQCNISQCNVSSNIALGIALVNTTYCNISYNEMNHTTNVTGGPGGSAMILQNSSCNKIYENNICNNAFTGIYAYASTDNNIFNNTFVDDGIRLDGSELSHYLHTIENNTVNGKPLRYYKNESGILLDENNATGQIILANCTNFEIRNMTLNNTDIAIELAYSTSINISNCTILNNSGTSIYLRNSSNNNITSNNIYNNGDNGITLYYSDNNNITSSNYIYNNSAHGMYLGYSDNNNISSNNISNNTNCGIKLANSNNNSITSSNQIFNNSHGINFYQSNNNNITSDNKIYNNTNHGISFSSSYNNTITSSNYIYNNSDTGICLDSSNSNNITSNYVYGNTYNGFNFDHSDNNTIALNQVYNNPNGFYFDHSDNNDIISNHIYNSSSQGVYLGHSYGNNIKSNQVYNDTNYGINLWNSSYNNITSSNQVYDNSGDGIGLGNSSDNNISSNQVYNNSRGINFGNSDNNTITSNNVYNNTNNGINLHNSNNNNITSNYVNNTSGGNWSVGINLDGCSDNIIYDNYFNNTPNVYDNGNNIWNTTKTLGTNIVGRPYMGGNYWSDYNGEDTDGDGIGDTNIPYNGTTSIDNGGDYLPLVVSSPPTQTGENPSNGSGGISLTPVLNITVDDVDDDSLTASWYSNSSAGSWALFATNNSIDTSSGSVNIIQTNSNFSSNSTTYWWSVNLTDGPHWTNATYHFTTLYIPNPPSGFTATTFNRTQINLMWTKGDKADKTYIEWNSIESWTRGSGTPLDNGTGTSYQHTDLSFGTTYHYQAWSWNNTDNCWSTTNSSNNATTNSNIVPVQSGENPTNNTGNIDKVQSTVNVTITDPDGDSFNWTIQGQYVTNADQNGDTNGSKSANLITPLPFNTSIIWYVNVTDGYNWTNATYNFTVRSQYIPNPPSSFTATKYNRTRIDLSWTNAGDNRTYIERNTTECWVRGSGTFIYNGTDTSYQNTSLNGNTHYFYQAWSWNETDNVYSTTNASANATTSNTVPSLNGETPANGSIDQQRWPACNITVTDVDADTMNISFYENTTGNWVLQQTNTSVASGTSVLWSNFTNASSFSTVYNWSVNVTDGHGGWTNETYNFTTLNQYVPDPPASFSATASSSSQIDLSWTKGNKANCTRIQRKTGGYPTSISDGTNVSNSTGTTKSDTGLSASTTYYYRAWSWNSTGNYWSILNSSTSATTKSAGGGPGPGPGDTTPPTTPINVRCTTPETDNTPSFSWDASTDTSGISGYYVKIDDGTDTWVGNVLTWTSTTAVEDGNHTFYVKAKDASSSENIGSYSSCSFTINTTAVGNPPVADPNGPYTGLTFQSISLDGSNSYDTDGTITNYTWDFGDGTTGYNVNPTHIYNLSGVYNITLTVTDNEGLTNSDTTTATILLDSDGDGWSDDMENSYGTNATDPTDQITDTDDDGIPDDDSPDGNYTGDPDDDDDGLDDVIEYQLGSDPKNKSDVKSIDDLMEGGYLVDTNGDGTYDKFYNSTSKINTTIEVRSDGKYNIDTDGDGKWNYIYDPASGTATPYEEKPSEEFPWIPAIIIIIVIIIVILVLLFKIGYISIEEAPSKKKEEKREKEPSKTDEKKK